MNVPLDLRMTLAAPPQGASSDVIASITLSCETLDLSHTGDLLTDPLTQRERRARETFAAFKGNRTTIDHVFSPVIVAIVAAVKGDVEVRSP